MDLMRGDNYHDISEAVRRFCSERYYELEKSLRPWVDGSLGNISTSHLVAYLNLLRDLAKLWRATERPETDNLIPAEQVQAMIQRLEEEMERRIEAAFEEGRDAARLELEAAEARGVEAARLQVLARMEQLTQR